MTNTWEQLAIVLAATPMLDRGRTPDFKHRQALGFQSKKVGVGTFSPLGKGMVDMADAEAIFQLMPKAWTFRELVSNVLKADQLRVSRATNTVPKASGLAH